MSFLINAKRVVDLLRDVSREEIRRILFLLLTIPDSRIFLAD